MNIFFSYFTDSKLAWALRVCGMLSSGFLAGCATYQMKVTDARVDLTAGRPADAATKLKKLAFTESKDQLIYLMDYGLALHMAGSYEESNIAFQKAADLAEYQDYHSVSKIANSLVFSEEMVQYKGAAYENLLLHVYGAKNYILLGEMDSALVEIRRINEIMEKFRIDEKKFEGQNVLAHYFSAIIWESEKNYDSAVIEYEKAYKLAPGNVRLLEDLIRANRLAGRRERYEELRQKHSEYDRAEEWVKKESGELILFFSQGWAPRKQARPDAPRFPMLVPMRSSVKSARIHIPQVGDFESHAIYSVEDVAMNTLAKEYDELVLKRLAGVATKAVVADQIRQKDKLLGELSWVVMNVADRADVRQWSTLPESFHVARIPLPAGEYPVEISGLSLSGVPMESREDKVQIKAGQKTFLIWRTFR